MKLKKKQINFKKSPKTINLLTFETRNPVKKC
jgi:hypothetical protein